MPLEPNYDAADAFLRTLDPTAEAFTFQTFDDNQGPGHQRDPTLAVVLNGSLPQCWDRLCEKSAKGAGVFHTVNLTDLRGRTKANILAVRYHFVDFDGVPIANLNRFPLSLHMFVQTSENKFHVYWRVEGATLAGFKTTQTRLNALLDSDPSVTDLSRVLRLPGFPHQKDPAHPFMVQMATPKTHAPFTDSEFDAALTGAETNHVGLTLPTLDGHAVPKYLMRVKDAPGLLNIGGDERPSDPHAIAERCAQVRRLRDAHGRLPEPEWYSILGVLAHCGDRGRETAHEWSSGDLRYRREDTDAKLNQYLANTTGPTTCAWFDSLHPGVCANCQNRGRISTPVQLGREVVSTLSAVTGSDDSAVSANAAEWYRTDLGNSRRLVARHGRNIRYVHASRSWLVWDGLRWVPDTDGAIMRLAKDTVEAMFDEAKTLADDKERAALRAHALASQAERRMHAMVSLAESEREVVASAAGFDADPWLLGVRNGVIDLRTGHFRPSERTDMLTMQAGVGYEPHAQCPNWLKFLALITGKDMELIAYHKRFAGYLLTGTSREEVMAVYYGNGGNGKSTLCETLHYVFGDYAIAADAGLLIEKKQSGGATPEIMRLKGRRLTFINETAENDKLAEARVKYLTSTDTITARGLYQDFVDFAPSHKTILRTNHKPIIRGSDEGIWRRVHLVPFIVRISTEIKDFREKYLIPEASGVLNWALEGCAEYLKVGLQAPETVKAATAAYRQEMDFVNRWIEEQCIIDPNSATPRTLAYLNFKTWCEDEVGWSISPQRWRRILEEKGYEATKLHGQRLMNGFKLRAPGPPVHAVAP